MNNDSRIKLGLVGAGGISQAYSAAFDRNNDQCRLVAVVDERIDRAKALADYHHAVFFGCHRQMLLETDLDGVIICTPPKMHPAQCIDFLGKGVHTLCEKPIAINLVDARHMVETAEDHDALFTMASKFRFVPDLLMAKQLIQDGLLGEIVLFENVFASFVDMSKRWNSQPEISGGGVLIDNGTHSLDIMRFLLGPLTDIRAVEGKRIQNLPVEDTVQIFARTEDGCLGSIDLSWSLNKQTPNFVSLFGSKGTLHLGWKSSQCKLEGEQEWNVIGKGYDKVEAFTGQLHNFCLAIRGQQSLIVQPDEALASVAAVETAYQSLATEKWERIVY